MTVYVIGCERGRLVKIGWTAGDPETRLADLQGGSPYRLRLLWQSGPEHWHEAEAKLHRLFKEYRTHGEWFDFGHADPVALIAAAIDLPARPRRHPATAHRPPTEPPPFPSEHLLDHLDAVMVDQPIPAAKVPAFLSRHYPDAAAYRSMTGKSLRAELNQLGIRVSSTGNKWPVNPSDVRAAITMRAPGRIL